MRRRFSERNGKHVVFLQVSVRSHLKNRAEKHFQQRGLKKLSLKLKAFSDDMAFSSRLDPITLYNTAGLVYRVICSLLDPS